MKCTLYIKFEVTNLNWDKTIWDAEGRKIPSYCKIHHVSRLQ